MAEQSVCEAHIRIARRSPKIGGYISSCCWCEKFYITLYKVPFRFLFQIYRFFISLFIFVIYLLLGNENASNKRLCVPSGAFDWNDLIFIWERFLYTFNSISFLQKKKHQKICSSFTFCVAWNVDSARSTMCVLGGGSLRLYFLDFEPNKLL